MLCWQKSNSFWFIGGARWERAWRHAHSVVYMLNTCHYAHTSLAGAPLTLRHNMSCSWKARRHVADNGGSVLGGRRYAPTTPRASFCMGLRLHGTRCACALRSLYLPPKGSTPCPRFARLGRSALGGERSALTCRRFSACGFATGSYFLLKIINAPFSPNVKR